MIKFTILLRRRSGMSHDDFVAYHRDTHASLFMSVKAVKDNVRRYVQQHTVEVDLPGMPGPTFDGVTELWFDDVASIGAVFGDSEYLAVIRPDEARFCDMDGCEFLVTAENVVSA